MGPLADHIAVIGIAGIPGSGMRWLFLVEAKEEEPAL